MRLATAFALLLAALGVASCSGSSKSTATAALLVPAETPASLNGLRRSRGRAAVARDRALDTLAAQHARAMARAGRMDHAVGTGFARRMKAAGIGAAAENIARGQKDVAAVMRAWSRSPGHRRNMLDERMTRYGLASVRAGDGRLYWAMILAR